jgi:hypothetical protein
MHCKACGPEERERKKIEKKGGENMKRTVG